MIYNVTYPITGHIEVEVEATSPEEAIDQAPDVWCELSRNKQQASVYWEFTNPVTQGNLCSAECNEAYAEPTEVRTQLSANGRANKN